MATAAEIQAWLAANPGASDATIAAAMQQYGVTTQQLAAASGASLEMVQSRYDAAVAGTNAPPAPVYLQPVATPAPVTLRDRIQAAYLAGDFASLNALLSANNVTAGAAAQEFGLPDSSLIAMRQAGVVFAPDPKPTTTAAQLPTLTDAQKKTMLLLAGLAATLLLGA